MSVYLLFLKNYYKEIIVGLGIFGFVFYIWYLNNTIDNERQKLVDYKEEVYKNNIAYINKINKINNDFKDYKSAFDLKTAKEKITIIEKTKIELQVIRISDTNSTLPPLEGNCTSQLKGRFNEKNAINRSI